MSEIIDELKKVADALAMTGASSASNTIRVAVADVELALERAADAAKAADEWEIKFKNARNAQEAAEKRVSEYASRDLGPEVRKLKEMVAAIDERNTELRHEIADLKAYRAEQNVKIQEMEDTLEKVRNQRRGLEQINRWQLDAIEVYKLVAEKRIDPDQGMRLAGYLATGNEPPAGAVDTMTLRLGMEAVKNKNKNALGAAPRQTWSKSHE